MITLEREMSASRGEFLHGLGLAFPGRVEESGGLLRVDDGAAAMEIALTPLPDRTIALLRLPNMKVRIRFTTGSREQQEAMLARMDRAMQRGGG
ncbi:hypothetical protein [Sulfurisoma sediminicola]|uniref:Uncharacterized protein n=1 Tax=Sulfurisoma sediminicola TaxID=1381557 RepID=A0A497XDZ2_9PROT|nr:hypothetical protein [Sulfurisoma sediminicola]RLJ65200.1 hypothetical protein DFR35_1856 [Sulfurisoma sediminicola]